MTSTFRSTVAGWGATALAGGAFWLAGRLGLSPPPLAHPAAWPSWWSELGPVGAVFAVGREVLVVAWVLWVTLLGLGTLARVGRSGGRAAATLLRAARVPGAGVMARAAIGLCASGIVVTGGAVDAYGATTSDTTTTADTTPPAPTVPSVSVVPPAPSAPVVPPVVVVPPPVLFNPNPPAGANSLTTPSGRPPTSRPVPAGTSTTVPPAAADSEPRRPQPSVAPFTLAGPSPTTRPAGTGTDSSATTVPPAVSPPQPPGRGVIRRPPLAGPHVDGSPPGTPGATAWTVRPGDCFWSIALAVVTQQGGSVPGDQGVVARYWVVLVAANRDRLPVPGDPDLLFPGDVLVLPSLIASAG